MSRTPEEIRADRRLLKAQHAELFDLVSALLFRHDPMRLNFELNTDEYEIEVGTILPRLRDCRSAADTRHVVHQEFVRWFGSTAGREERYSEIASEIWLLWQKKKYGSLM